MTIVIPGSKVTNSAGRSSTLGVFIFSEGTWYAFVPAHIFHANEKIRDGADGLVIGEAVTPPPYTENEPYPNISGALRLVRLFSYAPLRIGQQSRIRHVNRSVKPAQT